VEELLSVRGVPDVADIKQDMALSTKVNFLDEDV